MKTAVVFYSLEGNTKYVAEKIAEKMDTDLIELKPVKEFPKKGLAKFYHGGKSAVLKETPVLKPYEFAVEKYDKVILACPVWASNCAAPINTFLEKHAADLQKMGGQNIGIVLCQSGNGATKVIEKYKATLGVTGFAGELILIDPKKRTKDKEHNEKAIAEFCSKLVAK